MDHYDYIIVGAGAAGCVLANRLSDDPSISVLLVEAGPADRGWRIHMPAALAYPMQNPRLNWGYCTQPQPHLDNRRINWPRGRVLGGSSSINGMVYVRGHPLDFERWEQEGAHGWNWASVLPYFKRSESFAAGADPYRGADGPLQVKRADVDNPLHHAWIEAGRQAGYAVTSDINGYRQEGVGRLDMTIYRGRRWSAARAYLHPALKRRNLTVLTGALALRILFEGRRARGLQISHHGQLRDVRADREILLAGGAINSPQLLQLSGIGDPKRLETIGIQTVIDNRQVGENLQDHLCIYVQHECLTNDSLAAALKPLTKLGIGARWLATQTGPGASNHFETGGFIRTAAGVSHPDLQYHFMPLAIGYEDKKSRIEPSYQVDADALRPESRGSVHIRDADPRSAPIIDANYLSTEGDRRLLREAVRLTREIFGQAAFARFRGREIAPGPNVSSSAEIDAYVRATAESAYHPSCTCRMGSDDESVVDPECRVRGAEGLRVVDASIMPSILSGNLNGPTMMMAERAADLILGRPTLSAEPMPYFVAPDWQTVQR
ncbi:choline dehydrogenase [Pseudaminobacter sp. NGMCC 1.201702]|uniref:choline dehydrogenase n=1 Tax=Pseudaminobacter sp. NGMCC 1.201702 TaxID=3391825 RepID=UPI0039EE0686